MRFWAPPFLIGSALIPCSFVFSFAAFGQSTPQTAIASISVCSPAGVGGHGSCPAGTFDTTQIVLAPDGSGNAINGYSGLVGVSDEHQSVFSPGTLQSNNDYLFFVATTAQAGGPSTGAVVLSGGSGPSAKGQWTMDFATTDGYGSYPGGYAQIFLAPFGPGCPIVAGSDPTRQDPTFDLSYAAPGSVILDPSSKPGSMLMIYEGTNTCLGTSAGNSSANFFSSVGLATSIDYGHTWPTYRGKPGFTFIPLPDISSLQGPNTPMGALGSGLCEGTDCGAIPPVYYGRYPVLTPSISLTTAVATGAPLGGSMGDSQMSAFLDDVSSSPAQYVYSVYDYKAGTGLLADSLAPASDLMMARAKLNGGTAPLTFLKWNGQAFAAAGFGGYDSAIFPSGPFANCEAQAQARFGASISYVDDTQQYLLLFVCDSPGDPAAGQSSGAGRGAAWFYSTNSNLSNVSTWSSPQEITGSWEAYPTSSPCSDYKGFYPTAMSLNKAPAHLTTTGYVFFLWGCQTGTTPLPGRQYSSRAFTITTAPLGPALTQGSLANGATYASGGLVPGSWAQVKGTNLSSVTRIWGGTDFAGLGNNLPTSLSGVQVKVNNLPAAVYYIDAGQVDFQVPTGVSGTASVQVITNGAASNTLTASAAASAPGIFPNIVNGINYPVGVFTDGTLVGDPTVSSAYRNAKPGDSIQLYATGLVSEPSGVLPTPQGIQNVTVTVGSITVPADFAGQTQYVGEFQINFTVPQQFAAMAPGSYPISIAVNGISSPTTINTNPPGQLLLPITP